MLHKFTMAIGFVTLFFLIATLAGYRFSPFPNITFAFLALLFLLLGIEHFQADRKLSGAFLSCLCFAAALVIITSV